jgi:hypothetical protein
LNNIGVHISWRSLCRDMIRSSGSRPTLTQGLDREVNTTPSEAGNFYEWLLIFMSLDIRCSAKARR